MKPVTLISTTVAALLLTTQVAPSYAQSMMPYGGFNPMWGGMSPWSNSFTPWSGGSNPWSSSFMPWGGGNAWSMSMPWQNNGSGWGNSWSSMSFFPWSNYGGGRRNNDWVTSMFLLNNFNNQPWNTGAIPSYPYQSMWMQSYALPPAASAPMAPSSAPMTAPAPNAQSQSIWPTMPSTPSTGFPMTAPDSTFSPFQADLMDNQPKPIAPNQNNSPDALVFPDGSRF